MAESKPSVKSTDMPDEMREEVLKIASDALKSSDVEKDIAGNLKASLDQKYGPNWHCVVGKHFGSKVSHEAGSFLFFYIGNRAFQVYKFG
ncbi:hypothetical protein EG68_03177 [Paragonimus skrjabini miyazakii]|uniref:Dynein light chain n=1 Tax=Paragonimus skrjabini miyazakii TaxID=59628 RepID=A0A8S9YYS9_9TREM|nr:hypothetical protein EG68_03177 [Paragonimus skrjabini miyazakii]